MLQMDKPRKHYDKQMKPFTKGDILSNTIYVKSPE